MPNHNVVASCEGAHLDGTRYWREKIFPNVFRGYYEQPNDEKDFLCLIVSGFGLAGSIPRTHQQCEIARGGLNQ